MICLTLKLSQNFFVDRIQSKEFFFFFLSDLSNFLKTRDKSKFS